MNDRFKFRVYFKGSDYAKAGYQDLTRKDVIHSLNTNGVLIRDCIYECQQDGHEGSPCHIPFVQDNDMYVVQFCTGLKDKNGVLIYEGDILAFNDNKNDIGVVKYGDFLSVDITNESQSQTPSIGFYYEPQNVQLEPFCWNVQLIPFLLKKSKAEVIGNIYENPELLEVKNERQI